MNTFGSIDALVNNAGIYFSKPFTDYTVADLRSLISVNIEGFLFITQLAIKQMLAQKTVAASSISRQRRWIIRSPEFILRSR
jgi:NADP-dependent 3-hydroxy acid dehydrogenase YdfG